MSEKNYLNQLRDILENGTPSDDRTGVGTLSIFGTQTRYDLRNGFPAFTTKKLAWKAVVGELLWFLEGSVDERRLAELTFSKPRGQLTDKKTIWTANAQNQARAMGYTVNDEFAFLGTVYGATWRGFSSITQETGKLFKQGLDQIRWVIDEIKTNPDSRRLIVSAWNPSTMHQAALPPCHSMFQFYVRNGELSCQLYQRSADNFLGVPFNVASYALLIHIIARECDLKVGEFVHAIGDSHIYKNHIDAVKTQLSREIYDSPTLVIEDSFDLMKGLTSGFDYDTVSLFRLENYQHHEPIKADMAV